MNAGAGHLVGWDITPGVSQARHTTWNLGIRWRRGWDLNPRARFCQATRFRGGLFQPLRHLSAVAAPKLSKRADHPQLSAQGIITRHQTSCDSAHGAKRSSIHFENDVHVLAVAFNLQYSRSASGQRLQSRTQTVQRRHRLAIERVDHVSRLQIRFDSQ